MHIILFLLVIASLAVGGYFSLTFKNGEFESFKFGKAAIAGIVGAVVFFSLMLGIATVPYGSEGVLLRFGRPVGQLEPGLHFVRPVGDSVRNVAVQTRTVKPSEDAASKDLQIVTFEVTFRYHLDSKQAVYVLSQLNDDVEARIIDPAILEAIKSVTSQYDVQELVSKRVQVRNDIEALVNKTLVGTPVIAESTAVTDFKFSKDYENAIESKQVAQQKAEQAKNDLQRIEVEAQQAAAKAKGESDAVIAAATGDAQATLVNARAKAEAQRLLKQDLTPELLRLRTIEKWDGSVPYLISGGGNSPFNMLLQAPTERSKKQAPQSDDSGNN